VALREVASERVAHLDGRWEVLGAALEQGGEVFAGVLSPGEEQGDGANGGDFKFRFDVLPGNTDRGVSGGTSGVFGNDVTAIRNVQFSNTSSPAYSIFYDLDGSGNIFGNDVNLARDRQFSNLPAGVPLMLTQSMTLQTSNSMTTQSSSKLESPVAVESAVEELTVVRLETSVLPQSSATITPLSSATEVEESMLDPFDFYFAMTEDFVDSASELVTTPKQRRKQLV